MTRTECWAARQWILFVGAGGGALVGFVTVFGIRVAFRASPRIEGANLGFDHALRGATERFTPILMTALAIDSGNVGREIEARMAAVFLGGLFTSTLSSLLVLPTLALRCSRAR